MHPKIFTYHPTFMAPNQYETLLVWVWKEVEDIDFTKLEDQMDKLCRVGGDDPKIICDRVLREAIRDGV